MNGRARLRRALIALHLWLGLTIGAVWALQGLTGALLVLHREVDRAVLSGSGGPPVSLDRIVAAARASGMEEIARISIRDGARDVLLVEPAERHARTLLIDAADAHILGSRLAHPTRPGDGSTSRWLYTLHEALLLGDRGETLVGMSGLLLLSSALVGLWVGWPRRGQWRASFAVSRWRSGVQALYGWHRAVGLVAGCGLVLTTLSGAWMIFAGDLRPMLEARGLMRAPVPVPATTRAPGIGPEAAWRIASASFPGARLVRVTMPTAERPAYAVRLLQPGETRAWSGTTTVTVGAADGRVIDRYDPLSGPIGNRVADAAFPVHSGEIMGWPGRVAVMLLGLSLPMFYMTGLLAWLRRRKRRAARRATPPVPAGAC